MLTITTKKDNFVFDIINNLVFGVMNNFVASNLNPDKMFASKKYWLLLKNTVIIVSFISHISKMYF